MNLALLLALTVPAGYPSCYSYSRPYYGSYYRPYYQQSYQPSYTTYEEPCYPVQKVVASEISVAPLIVTVPVDSRAVPAYAYGSPYYWSGGDAYQQKAQLREVLREELRSMLGQQQAGQTAAIGQPYAPAPLPLQTQQTQQAQPPPLQTQQTQQTQQSLAPVPPPEQSTQARAWVPEAAIPEDVQKEVLTALTAAKPGSRSCVSCHGGGTKDEGGFKLVLATNNKEQPYRLTRLTADKRWKVYGLASVGGMPPEAATDTKKALDSKFLPVLLKYAAYRTE